MAAITCLTDYIGLRGTCATATPVSGLYVNDLAGISLKALANLSNEEQQSYQGVWDEIQRRALAELESDTLVKMQKYFKPNVLIENNQTGYFLSPPETETASAFKKGVAIDIIGSKNMVIFINQVELYTVSAITDSIKIYDYNNGSLLDTIAFTSVANTSNVIVINKSYDLTGQKKKLFISYNGALTNSIKTTYNPYWEDSANFSIVRGASVASASSVIESNLTFDSNSGGLIVNFNVACSIQRFICMNRESYKTPLLYKLGEHVMLERLTSERLNELQ